MPKTDTATPEEDLDALSAALDAELDALAYGDDGAPDAIDDDADDSQPDENPAADTAQDADDTAGETEDATPKPEDPKPEDAQQPDPNAQPADKKKSPFQRRQEEIQEKLRQVKTERDTLEVEKSQLREVHQQVQSAQTVIGNFYATLQKQVPGLVALKPGERLRDEQGRTAEDYTAFARELDKRGDDDRATIAREYAAKLEAQEKLQINLRTLDEQRVRMFDHEQGSYWRKAKEEVPEIASEGMNPVKQALKQLFVQNPWVMQTLGGPLLAARLVRAQLQQTDAAATTAENAKLKARVAELESRVAHVPPAGTAPRTRPGNRHFGDLNPEEMEAELERELAGPRRR